MLFAMRTLSRRLMANAPTITVLVGTNGEFVFTPSSAA